MPEYIEREALKKLLLDDNAPWTASTVIGHINKCPAADVEPVRHGRRHGRWEDVYLSSPSSYVGTCSVCGRSNDIPPPMLAHYCPNCGAKMDMKS